MSSTLSNFMVDKWSVFFFFVLNWSTYAKRQLVTVFRFFLISITNQCQIHEWIAKSVNAFISWIIITLNIVIITIIILLLLLLLSFWLSLSHKLPKQLLKLIGGEKKKKKKKKRNPFWFPLDLKRAKFSAYYR